MTELMSSGVELMLAGMGIVFLFLAMLVVAINIMSSMVQRFFPDAQALVITAPVSSGIDKSMVAAITAAVHQYRSKHRQD
ncbi:MAG: OadG family transporter subunit [Methylococcales bacterium]|nr:OadG family transporter subunit [Methylococcales bacterium]